MPVYTYTLENSSDITTVRISVGSGEAVAKLMKLPGNVSKMESFSTPPAARGPGRGGLSYALVKLLLEQCSDKVVRVDTVHGYLHYTLGNLKMACGAWRKEPTYKGEKTTAGVVDPSSYPRQTRDYVTYTPDTSLWLAMMKCVEKGITLRPAA